jgi:EpsD family peptidyl-prolyl cis-trans isomerase
MRPGPCVIVALALSACGTRPDLAATVNGRGISVEQFRQALAQAGSAALPASGPRQLLDGMIDRELLVEKAEQLKLDRSLPVAQAIEAARANILAQVYVEHSLGTRPSRSQEVSAFYDDHAALFAGRRIYRLFELAIIAPEDRIADIRQRVVHARGLYEIAEWLKSQNLAFNAGGVTRSSEYLAPALLQQVSGMKEGQVAIIEVPGGASIVQLIHSEHAPLSRDQAAPMIEELLRARRRLEVAEREVKFLRGRAAIEYAVDLGERPETTAHNNASRPER